jgi:hypothetical protein
LSKTGFIPLTPEKRDSINSVIRDRIKEIETCEDTPWKSLYVTAYNAMETLINALPDGYPLPVEENNKYEN